MEQIRNENNLEQQQQQQQQEQQQPRVNPPEPPAEHCPRCNSFDIKFCYYNNYSLSQPRYFCKTCQRYWTHGGTLRNIPIGSGCRRGKRARTSDASSSIGNDLARTTCSFFTAVRPPQNGGIFPGQLSRAFPPLPVMSPMNNSFQGGGATFYSRELQTLPSAINQGATVGVGGRDAYFGANLALLRGFALAHLQPQVPHQFQMHNNLFPTQGSMILPRPAISWSQSLIDNTAGNSLGGSPYFWSGGQASSSSNPSQWSADKHPGYGPLNFIGMQSLIYF